MGDGPFRVPGMPEDIKRANGPIFPPRIHVSNDELVSVRAAMRGMNRMVDQLESGEAEKFVLMKKGRMVAVVIPMRAYR